MSNQPAFTQLDRSPIIEAIIAFECSGRLNSLPENALDQVREALGENFPIVQESGSGEYYDRRLGPNGVQALDADPPTIAQHFAPNIFSFNKLKPYLNLDEYLGTIEKSWNIYREIFDPDCVDRISLRYVNRIPLPFADDQVELCDYFHFVPEHLTEENSSRITSGYYQSVQYLESPSGDSSQVTLASTSTNSEEMVMILDIEVTNAEPLPEDFKELLPVLGRLRQLKNDHFYSKVTEKCLQLFHD